MSTRKSRSVKPASSDLESIRQDALEFAGIGLYRYTFDGTVLFMDRGALKILDLEAKFPDPAAVAGKNIADLFVYTGQRGLLRTAVRKHRHVRGLEYRFRTLSGVDKCVTHDSYLVTDPQTGEDAIQVVMIDVTERQRAEDQLQHVLRGARCILWHATVDELEDGTLHWEIRVSNEQAAEQLLPLERKPGQTYSDVWHTWTLAEDRVRIDQNSRAALKAGQPGYTQEFRTRRADAEIRWLHEDARVQALRPTRWLVVGVCTDVTERRRTEEELRLSEERFRQVADAAREWIWEVDAEGMYTYSSPLVEQILGYKPEEVVGKKYFYDLFWPEDREQIKKAAFEVFARKLPFREFTNRCLHRNGETRWLSTTALPILDSSGALQGYRGADIDITERREAEEALRLSEERYRGVVDAQMDLVVRFLPDTTMTFVNPALCRLLHMPADELIGKSFLPFLPPEAHERLKASYAALSPDAPVTENENRMVVPGIGPRWYHWTNRGIFDAHGHLVELQAVGRDVTERKLADAQQRAMSAGLRAVVSIADELIACRDVDHFFRRAVELAREKLGLERCAIFVQEGKDLRGTFGTDRHGHTTDERLHRFPTRQDWLERFHALQPQERRMIVLHQPFVELQDGRAVEYGHGWIALTPIQSATEFLGLFSNDAAISGSPMDETKQEIVSVFCSMLGAILERKHTENRQRELSEGLQAIVAIADDLISCPDVDALYRCAVERARSKLGVERCAIFVWQGSQLTGTYGTNRKGETTDEHTHYFAGDEAWFSQLRTLRTQETRMLVREQTYHEWKGDHTEEFGRGWVAVTPIQFGAEFLGVLCNDTAITGAPLDATRQELLSILCSLLGAIVQRATAEARHREMSARLRTVLAVADELIACPSADALYRRAVELAREKLGVERCAIFLQEGSVYRGTYGTNLQRQTTVEMEHTFEAYAAWLEHFRAVRPEDRQMILRDEPFTEWDGQKAVTFDRGWIAITPIQSASQFIGVFSNDTAVTRAPVNAVLQEVVAVYCSLLGSIIERKRGDEELADLTLAVVTATDELISCPDLDTFYRRAVELAREKLGVERCGLFLRDGELLRGTYGTDRHGRTTDEHNHLFKTQAEWVEGIRALRPQDTRRVFAEESYAEWDGEKEIRFGKGWIVITPIQSATEVMGVFCNDCALSGAPIDPIRQEIVSLYCSLLGGIIVRKRAEEEIRRLAMVVEQEAEAVMISDTAGSIQYVNPSFEHMTGHTREEVLGRNPRILKSGKQDAVYYQRMWQTLTSGYAWDGHFTNRRKDGTLYETEATISPIRDASGGIVGYVATSRDVTREMQLEEQFRRAQKMEAIGRLAGGIAHDFNNLLTSILGYSRMIREALGDGHPMANDADEIIRAGERAAALTKQLLTFSRKQMIEAAPLNLNAVIMDIDKLLRRTLGEDIELVTVIDSAQAFVSADTGMLEQVIINLAVNSRGAMPKGGKLVLQTGLLSLDEDACPRHMDCQPGDYAMLLVRDTGVGMTEEVREHCFDPFFTTKEMGKGTGLGLSIVYSIVKQLKGFIEIDTAPNAGTEVRIYFPRIEAPAGRPVPREEVSLPHGSETILVVEDEDTVRRLTVRMLESIGYHVLEARHGGEALLICERHRDPIHLVLTDVVMPHLGGQELVERLLKIRRDFRVLFMSGFTDEAFVRHGLRDGVAPMILKPFTHEALAVRIRQALDKR